MMLSERYANLKRKREAIRKSDNAHVVWFEHPEHGLLPARQLRNGELHPLDRRVQWNDKDFYAAFELE